VSLPTIPSRWPRCLHAQLIERLSAAGADTIVFDVLFRERPPLPGVSGDLHAWQDDGLASAIASAGRVVIAQKVEAVDSHEILAELSPVVESAALGSAPLPLVAEAGGRVDRFMAFKETGLVIPTLPTIAMQAYSLSAYPMLADLLARATDDAAALLPTTAEAVTASGHLEVTSLLIRQLFRNDRSLARRVRDEMHRRGALSADASSSARLGALVSMYAGDDTRLLNLYGPAGTLRAIGFDQALTSSPEALSALCTGRAVFVGFAETAQHEQVEHFATAFSSGDSPDLSGVEIAATAFSNLLEDRTIRALPFRYRLAVTFLAGVLSLVACAWLRNRVALAVMAAAVGLYGGAALYLFASHQVWMPTVVPMFIAVPAGMLLAFAWKYWNAHRQREHLRHAFSYFVPREVVNMLERNAGQIGTSPESIECACVATDAANFTPLAETMTPEELTDFLNHYFEALFGRVADHGGFVSDVVGDAMLAIWPHRSADTHLQLLHGVLEMHDAARQFNERLAGNRLMTRFGVDWGRVALTTVGAHGHYEYRAVGDAVNTATRIQELNKKLGTSILVSQPAIGDAGNDFLLRDLGRFLLRGKTQSVHLCELLGTRAKAASQQSDLCARFANALGALTGGQQAAAVAQLQQIHRVFPTDGPTAFFLRSLESGVQLQDGALVVD
jgi:adenylate cyclase